MTQLFSNPRFTAGPVFVWLLGIGLTAATMAAVALYRPPWPLEDDAPIDRFSAARAMEHVRTIAREPHPFGSPAQQAVKDYICERIRAIGLEPFELDSPPRAFGPAGPPIVNIATRLSGSASTGAVLLMAHYDSKRGAPGAADDGSGVATLLETMRAVQAGARTQNDIIFLFTDSEETGLRGATAFVHGSDWEENSPGHPWKDDVRVVLNFDGRGSRGVVVMPDAGDNGWLITQLAKAAPYPIANSLMRDVQKRMPNSSDLDPFRDSGFPSMNFNFMDGYPQYHSPLDIPDRLSPATLQHMGEYAVPLARHFGALDLNNAEGGKQVYFNPIAWFFVHYPAWLNWPLLVLTLAGYAGAFYLSSRHGQVSILQTLYGAIVHLVTIAAAGGAAYGLSRLLSRALGDRLEFVLNQSIGVHGAAALLIVALILVVARIWLRAQDLTFGALAIWLLTAIAVTIWFPGGSPLFVWPALALLLAMTYHGATDDFEQVGTGSALLLLLSGAVVIFMFVPNILAMNLAIAPIQPELAAVAVVLAVLAAGLLTPHFSVILEGNRWIAPGVLLAATNVFLLATLLLAQPREAAAQQMAREWAEQTSPLHLEPWQSPTENTHNETIAAVRSRLDRGDYADAFAPVYEIESAAERIEMLRRIAATVHAEERPIALYSAAMDAAIRVALLEREGDDSGEMQRLARQSADELSRTLQPFAYTAPLDADVARQGRDAAATYAELSTDTADAATAKLRLAKFQLALGLGDDAVSTLKAARDALPEPSPLLDTWMALALAVTSETPTAQRDSLFQRAAAFREAPGTALAEDEGRQLARAINTTIPGTNTPENEAETLPDENGALEMPAPEIPQAAPQPVESPTP